MQKGLVSIISPCYNTGKLIHRLLDSVLNQSYPQIEMIVVDDGSSDNSASVIKSYIDKFANKGYSLTYVYQENGGQSVALKEGLNLISGEFLVWPDSDDFYSSTESIQKMVDALKNASSEFAVVRTWQRVVAEDTLEELFLMGDKVDENRTYLFEDCLLVSKNFYWGAGAYMIRSESLRETTGFDIYTEKYAGQNWQIFLPVLYSYRCLTIKDVLYTVLSRRDSHSRNTQDGFEKKMMILDVYERTALETLKRISNMPQQIRLEYERQVKEKIVRDRLRVSFLFRQRDEFIKWYRTITNKSNNFKRERLLNLFVRLHMESFYFLLKRLRQR